MDYGLRDRAVLITGGARGIGFAAAQMFAAEGARVALVDIDQA
ncbi:MAG: SDR family NAD(P)-dependent oxidoreductase, partial [Pseudomonadota bacterium]